MRVAMLVYTIAFEIVTWVALVPGLWLAGRWGDIDERLGRCSLPPRRGRCRLVLHAVSGGEMHAAAPLVSRLLAEQPEADIVLCTGTRDGLTAARRLQARHAGIAACCLLPWDRPLAMRRWMAGLGADRFLVVETELWPGLFAAARALGIPLFLVSARLYPRDVGRYALLRGFWRRVLAQPHRILVQDATERDAFVHIGAPAERVVVGGNLKFDAAALAEGAPRPPSAVPVIVAASTHAPEERVIADAVAHLRRAGIACELILAPRHVTRAASVRRATGRAGVDARVIDRFGGLADALDAADIVVLGGTIARRGGHNPIEPAARGLPCIVGPHVSHIRVLVEDLERAGAVHRVSAEGLRSNGLALALADLLRDEPRRMAMGRAARDYCARQRGASARVAAEVGAPSIASSSTASIASI